MQHFNLQSALRLAYRGGAAALLCLLAACSTPRAKPYPDEPMHDPSGPAAVPATPPSLPQPPTDPQSIADAVPKPVVRSRRGNPPFYDVLGKRYFVRPTSEGFVERGVASWYGPGFHKESTSTGERYDMYAMTAAHKTLPLPCYARITNLSNGKSVVVYINDRGPFKDERIVDLSYTAAQKLDFIKAGTALVELRVLTAGKSADTGPVKPEPLFVQAGAFSDEGNALRLVDKLRAAGYQQATATKQNNVYRVRIGPVPDVAGFDRIVKQLKSLGIGDARLALSE